MGRNQKLKYKHSYHEYKFPESPCLVEIEDLKMKEVSLKKESWFAIPIRNVIEDSKKKAIHLINKR